MVSSGLGLHLHPPPWLIVSRRGDLQSGAAVITGCSWQWGRISDDFLSERPHKLFGAASDQQDRHTGSIVHDSTRASRNVHTGFIGHRLLVNNQALLSLGNTTLRPVNWWSSKPVRPVRPVKYWISETSKLVRQLYQWDQWSREPVRPSDQ